MIYDEFELNGKNVKIYYDDCAESPRTAYDNMWHLVSNNRNISCNEGDLSLKEVMENRKELERQGYIFRPVYMYQHSGIALSLAPFSCPWDSGLGFVAYIHKDELRKEYNTKRVTKAVMEKAMNVLKGEVETYGYYLNGETYGVEITDAEGNEEDSCWGFYGDEHARDYANDMCKVA